MSLVYYFWDTVYNAQQMHETNEHDAVAVSTTCNSRRNTFNERQNKQQCGALQ